MPGDFSKTIQLVETFATIASLTFSAYDVDADESELVSKGDVLTRAGGASGAPGTSTRPTARRHWWCSRRASRPGRHSGGRKSASCSTRGGLPKTRPSLPFGPVRVRQRPPASLTRIWVAAASQTLRDR